MKRLWLLYRPKIVLTGLISALFLWAVTSTAVALFKKQERLYIKISRDQVSVDDKTNSEDDRILELNFLRNFVMFVYNFDELNYLKNLNRGSYMMSDSFWTSTSKEIPKVLEVIRSQRLQQSSIIEKLVRLDTDSYDLFTVSQYQIGSEIETRKFKIRVKLQKVDRTRENPWGLEVVSADQDRIL